MDNLFIQTDESTDDGTTTRTCNCNGCKGGCKGCSSGCTGCRNGCSACSGLIFG